MIETVISFDLYLTHAILLWRSVWLTPIMIFFTRLGDDQIAYPFVALTILLLLICRRVREAGLMLFTLLVSAILNTGIKELVGRMRPLDYQLVIETDFSFPSGHAMNSIVYFGLLTFLVLKHIKSEVWRRWLISLAFVFSFMMGVSRIYLGVHYFSDVVVGYLLGAIIVSIAIWIGNKRIFSSDRKRLSEEDTMDA